MSSSSPVAVRHIRRAATLCEDGLSDARLLGAFLSERDEAAFEKLVRRHGPMVLGVCRRVAGNSADADDAFQATFLVLVRRAGALTRRELLGNWLYGVAFRTALGARTRMLRRRTKEQPVKDLPHPAVEPDERQPELLALLDRELNRLPAKYRVPVILCELDGTSRKEAAQQLGIPEGTLSSRLAAGRRMLAVRLTRNGVAMSVTAVAAALSQSEASASVPSVLIGSTVKAAVGLAAGDAVPASVAALTQGVLKAMLLSKLKIGATILAAVVLGAGTMTYEFGGMGTVAAAPQDAAKPKAQPAAKQAPPKLEGAWKVESMVEDGKERPLPAQGPPHMFFVKDKIHLTIGDRVEVTFTFKSDASKKPAQIDMSAADDKKMVGIYTIDGDTLRICLGEPGKDGRPTSFESGQKVALMTLKRAPEAKMPEVKPGDVDRVKTAAARTRSANTLKQMLLAMHNYHDANGALPAAAIYDTNGKPGLSWRVAILPYIEQDALYKKFKLDEPWDSTHNKKLIAQMPKIYAEKGTKTHYRVFVGKGAGFEGTKGLKFTDFTDGLSNTLLIVEAVDPVEWTKPEEFEYDPEKKLPKLGGTPFEKGFHVGMADGSVRFVPVTVPEKTLRATITRNGGEVIDPE